MTELVLVKSDVSRQPEKRISNHARLERERLLKEEIFRYHRETAILLIRLRRLLGLSDQSTFVIDEITDRMAKLVEHGRATGFSKGFETRLRFASESLGSEINRIVSDFEEVSKKLEEATDSLVLPILMEG